MIRTAAKHVAIGAGGIVTCFSFGFAIAETVAGLCRVMDKNAVPADTFLELYPHATITDWKQTQ